MFGPITSLIIIIILLLLIIMIIIILIIMEICRHFIFRAEIEPRQQMVRVKCTHHCTFPAPQEVPIMDPIKALQKTSNLHFFTLFLVKCLSLLDMKLKLGLYFS